MFKLGVLLCVVLVVWAIWFGGTDTDTAYRVTMLVTGWSLFAPVRRALWGGDKDEPKTNEAEWPRV